MKDPHGDEHLIDTSDVRFTDDQYFYALQLNAHLAIDRICELADSPYPITSKEFHSEVNRFFHDLIETSKQDALLEAELDYLEQEA